MPPDSASLEPRLCAGGCGQPIPLSARSDRVYADQACKQRAYRERRGSLSLSLEDWRLDVIEARVWHACHDGIVDGEEALLFLVGLLRAGNGTANGRAHDRG